MKLGMGADGSGEIFAVREKVMRRDKWGAADGEGEGHGAVGVAGRMAQNGRSAASNCVAGEGQLSSSAGTASGAAFFRFSFEFRGCCVGTRTLSLFLDQWLVLSIGVWGWGWGGMQEMEQHMQLQALGDTNPAPGLCHEVANVKHAYAYAHVCVYMRLCFCTRHV